MAKTKVNHHCTVRGCKTKKLHCSDDVVQTIMLLVNYPAKMCEYVMEALQQLGTSAYNDLANRNALGFITRLRQIEELYIRTLYLLLIAEPAEQAHIISGEMPKGLSEYYKKVNKLIFLEQVDWGASRSGLRGDSFTIMEVLHDGAHVSYKSLFMAKGYLNDPEAMVPERYAKHIEGKLTKLEYMRGMFNAGKAKEHVLGGVRDLHRPASYWEEEQRKAKM